MQPKHALDAFLGTDESGAAYEAFGYVMLALDKGQLTLSNSDVQQLLDVVRRNDYDGPDWFQRENAQSIRLYAALILSENPWTSDTALAELLELVGAESAPVIRKIGRHPLASATLRHRASALLNGPAASAEMGTTQQNSLLSCPYCHLLLKRIPKAQSKCPHCRSTFRVRTTQMLFFPRFVLTGEEATACDVFRYLDAQPGLNGPISEADYHEQRLRLRGLLGSEPSPKLVLCALMAQVAAVAKEVGNFRIESNLAYLLHHPDNDGFALLREVRRLQALEMQRTGMTHVRISADAGACASCVEHADDTLAISAALETLPLPHATCSGMRGTRAPGYCRCRYTPVRG